MYMHTYNMTDPCFVLNSPRRINIQNSHQSLVVVSPRQAGLMTIRTDDMETAGEMVQDLCSFLQVQGGLGKEESGVGR